MQQVEEAVVASEYELRADEAAREGVCFRQVALACDFLMPRYLGLGIIFQALSSARRHLGIFRKIPMNLTRPAIDCGVERLSHNGTKSS